MHKPYNNEKLNGTPRTIETRVFRVDQESGEEAAISNIPVFVNNGPHYSDRRYTPFGALKEETYYEFLGGSSRASSCGLYYVVFDEHNNIMYEEYHYEGRSGKNEYYLCTFENEYDGEGRLVRQTGWDEHDDMKHKTVAEFDDRGLMSRKTKYNYYKPNRHYYLSGVEMFEYDDDGKMTRMTIADGSGRVWREETWEYDGNGSLSRKIIRYPDWGETIRITYRKATEYFIMIRTSYCEKIINYRSSQFDDHGNVVAAHQHNVESSLDFDDNLWKTERRDIIRHFDYVYDEHGNWTRHDYYQGDEHYYATRKIEYYD